MSNSSKFNNLRKMWESKNSDDFAGRKSSDSNDFVGRKSSDSSKKDQIISRLSKYSGLKKFEDKSKNEESKKYSNNFEVKKATSKTALVIDDHYNAKQELIDSSNVVIVYNKNENLEKTEGSSRDKTTDSSIFADTLVNAIHELAKPNTTSSATKLNTSSMEGTQKYEDTSLKEEEPVTIFTIDEVEPKFEHRDLAVSENDSQKRIKESEDLFETIKKESKESEDLFEITQNKDKESEDEIEIERIQKERKESEMANINDSQLNNFISKFHSTNDFSNTKFSKNLQQMLKLLLTAKCYCVLIYEGM